MKGAKQPVQLYFIPILAGGQGKCGDFHGFNGQPIGNDPLAGIAGICRRRKLEMRYSYWNSRQGKRFWLGRFCLGSCRRNGPPGQRYRLCLPHRGANRGFGLGGEYPGPDFVLCLSQCGTFGKATDLQRLPSFWAGRRRYCGIVGGCRGSAL